VTHRVLLLLLLLRDLPHLKKIYLTEHKDEPSSNAIIACMSRYLRPSSPSCGWPVASLLFVDCSSAVTALCNLAACDCSRGITAHLTSPHPILLVWLQPLLWQNHCRDDQHQADCTHVHWARVHSCAANLLHCRSR
jgi:hypothetical protein